MRETRELTDEAFAMAQRIGEPVTYQNENGCWGYICQCRRGWGSMFWDERDAKWAVQVHVKSAHVWSH